MILKSILNLKLKHAQLKASLAAKMESVGGRRVNRTSRLMCFVIPAMAIMWRSNRYLDVNPNPQDLTPAIMCALTVGFLLLSGFAWSTRAD